jgi:HK97 gp10 family phage protein
MSALADWSGVDAAFAKLRRLESRIQQTALADALRVAAAPMLADARARAPRETGLLARALIMKAKRRGGVVSIFIGPNKNVRGVVRMTRRGVRAVRIKRGAAAAEGSRVRVPVRYAHVVEFGGRHVAARPFLRPAFDSTKEQSLTAFKRRIGPAIEAAARRFS